MLYLAGLLTENQYFDRLPVQTAKLPAGIKKKANDALHDMGNYHDGIPINLISSVLQPFGIYLANEDNTPFGGFFTGRDGRTNIDLMQGHPEQGGRPISNSMLVLTWHKMEQTGRYEIVAYLS